MGTNDYRELLNRIYGTGCWSDYTQYARIKKFPFREYVFTDEEYSKIVETEHNIRGRIKNVKFNPPATIVFWTDNTKTVVKCNGEDYDPEKGLAMCICKKVLGNKGNYYEVFKKWLPKEDDSDVVQRVLRSIESQTFEFNLKPIDINIKPFEVLTGTNDKITIEFKDAKEEPKHNPVEEAYEKLVEHRDGDGEIDLDELIGLLGEALDS